MNTQPPSIYQRVIDKTKALAFQSQFIAQKIDKKLSSRAAMAAIVLPTPTMVREVACISGVCELPKVAKEHSTFLLKRRVHYSRNIP